MLTSKSTLKVARMALTVAKHALADFARTKSPKKFTQPQLLACLIVKEFSGKDYRGIHTMLAEWSDLRNVLGLRKVPHFTTLCQASKRLLSKKEFDSIRASVLSECRKAKLLKNQTKTAALDSTGLETRHVSSYYTKRCSHHKAHKKRRYPKLSALCDTANHLILGIVINRGPKPDHVEAYGTVNDALKHQQFETLLGDAGYESEGFHRYCRDQLGIESIIPTTQRGRLRDDGKLRTLNGRYRRELNENFPRQTYGQRWQIETVFSMIKRNFGSALRSRTYHNQTREIRARVLAHNLAILLW